MWKRFVMIGAMAAAVVPLAGGPAWASSAHNIFAGGEKAGYGSFESYGDHFKACDVRSDGYGIRLDWYVPATGNSGAFADTSGNDGICANMNTNIGEGRQVMYRLCMTNNGSLSSCTIYFEDYA